MKDRIKWLRKELNMTQREFGERIGVKCNTVAQYEMGRNEPINAVVTLICKEFNVSEEWLRDGTGEMFEDMNRNEQAMRWIKSVISDDDNDFKHRFVIALSLLSEQDWKVIEKIYTNFAT